MANARAMHNQWNVLVDHRHAPLSEVLEGDLIRKSSMKIFKTVKVVATATVVAAALNMTGFTYAVSSTAAHGIKDFKIAAHNGKVSKAQVAVAVRRGYKGVVPRITPKPSPMYPNCYNARFMYKGELKRVTFNCSKSNTELTMLTR